MQRAVLKKIQKAVSKNISCMDIFTYVDIYTDITSEVGDMY